ncbi:MAG: putative signaling protein, partial [Conexibacter sp.]|nr:putative signaling protein [Conexibacter sp.]
MTATRAPLLSTRLTGRNARVLNFLTGAAIALGLADLVVLSGVPLSSPKVGTIVLPLATALVAAGLAATRLLWSTGDRTMWILLTAGLAATLLGGIVSAIGGGHLDHAGAQDVFWLLAYPPWYAALVVISRHYLGGAHRSFWLDGLLIGLASATYVSALFLGDISGLSDTTLAVNVAYPAADLALLGILFGTLLMIGRPSPQGLVLAAGLVLMLASDTLRVVGLAAGHGAATSSVNVCWSLALLAIASAAWARPAPGRVLPVGGW